MRSPAASCFATGLDVWPSLANELWPHWHFEKRDCRCPYFWKCVLSFVRRTSRDQLLNVVFAGQLRSMAGASLVVSRLVSLIWSFWVCNQFLLLALITRNGAPEVAVNKELCHLIHELSSISNTWNKFASRLSETLILVLTSLRRCFRQRLCRYT